MSQKTLPLFSLLLPLLHAGAHAAPAAPQWEMVELTFEASGAYDNPYADVEFWVAFTHENGDTIQRPGFWDGGDTWKARFASTEAEGVWRWESFANVDDSGLIGQTGALDAEPARGDTTFSQHGFWRIPYGSRWMEYADGTPALMVADTPWAIPWRATREQVEIFAADRKAKGFNAALLMSVMPDMRAEGPRDRTQYKGFGRGFEDLPLGHLNEINIDYFQYLDTSIVTLVEHGIAPVWQPVFHGFGWKGLSVAGPVVPADEYARYCRYLVARYGAYPAMWLICGDGSGFEPGIMPGGEEVERWDAYRQPTGLHYGPHWPPQAHQAQHWLDFQWVQTGHNAEHRQDRLASMWHYTPVKAAANGEPTYENIGEIGKGAGWWQGHEAWSNLTAGGTMGVVYGAGSLWNWIHEGEPADNDGWARAPDKSWRDAIDFEGSAYVGLMTKILAGLPLKGAKPDNTTTLGRRALFKPRELLIVYLEDGGWLNLRKRNEIPDAFRVYDPKTGDLLRSGELTGEGSFGDTGQGPRVIIFSKTYFTKSP